MTTVLTVCWQCGHYPVKVGDSCTACKAPISARVSEMEITRCGSCLGRYEKKNERCPYCGTRKGVK